MNITKFIRHTLPVLAGGVLLSTTVSASELIYAPVNPTFGGNPANASGLQANAAAQNNYKAPVITPYRQTPLEAFNSQVQAAILTRLKGQAVDGLFDAEGSLRAGKTVNVGSYIISTSKDSNGDLVLTTEDKTIPNSRTTITLGSVSAGVE